jgi:hypothetical protein
MRRLVLAGMAVLVAAGLAASASARSDAPAVGPVACGTAKQWVYLSWPHGHPAIPDVNFQNFPIPHAELYQSPPGLYPDSKFGGFLTATGGAFAKTCKAVRLGRLAPLAQPKTLTETGAVRCSFPRAPDHVILKSGGGTQLLTVEPPTPGTRGKPQIEVSLTVTAAGSTLKYDGKLCRSVAGPKPPQLMKFSFATLAASWTNGSLNWAVTFSGTSCGGAARGPWTMIETLTLNGSPVGQPLTRQVDLASGSGGFTILKERDDSGSADGQFQVADSTIALGVTLKGTYSGLSVGTPQAQIASEPVAAC